MNFEKDLIIGLIIRLQEQTQILLHCIELLIECILEEDDDEVVLLDARMPISRNIWMFNRYGNFWEKDIPNNNEDFFKESFRVERNMFLMLVQKLEVMRKKDTRFRRAIQLEKRIAIALYTLGSSSEYRTIGRLFGVSTNSVCNILHEFCS